jgi:hypothetical protein
VGLEVKHRQLAHQVGVLIEDPSENSMASFNFTSAVLDEGMTFTFGSWFCIANGRGGFKSHLAGTREPTTSAPASCHDIDDLADELGEIRLSDLIGNHKDESRSNPAPTCDWLDSISCQRRSRLPGFTPARATATISTTQLGSSSRCEDAL